MWKALYDSIQIYFVELCSMLYVELIYLAQDRTQWQPVLNNVNKPSGTPIGGEFSGS